VKFGELVIVDIEIPLAHDLVRNGAYCWRINFEFQSLNYEWFTLYIFVSSYLIYVSEQQLFVAVANYTEDLHSNSSSLEAMNIEVAPIACNEDFDILGVRAK
jgi:hypothetical protein